ncbi:hypothetical protein [Francisella marina]|uniref:hypothetical protein n=1 Tax=Francisella marina TaxID=2249302 RepID=UPI00165E01E2|nr:hypothetical protein [Francisella marina]
MSKNKIRVEAYINNEKEECGCMIICDDLDLGEEIYFEAIEWIKNKYGLSGDSDA